MNRLITILILTSLLIGCTPASQTTLPTPPPTDFIRATDAAPVDESTQWWRDAIFYEIFVRSFYDSDNDGIGDFNGIIQKLDYLDELGINAIWLMPIHPSPTYHGYDVMNYYAVNTQYGTMEDFKNLLAEAHQRKIKIIIDLLLNHTSSRHPFFIEANNNPQSPYRDWYLWSGTFNGNHWHKGNNGFYYGFFEGGMPDLNYNNPDVTAQMQNVMRFWLEDVGVDGFRVDAAKHLIEEGGRLENTKATHEWFKDFYTFYKSSNPNAYTIGEVFSASSFVAKTYENQFDHIFNFELANGFITTVQTGSNSYVNSAIKLAQKEKPDFGVATFLTNHDQNRIMSVLEGDIQKAKLAAFLMLTLPGTPYIYYGEEIGMQGIKPDKDIRLPMQWASDASAGFSTVTPWRAPYVDYPQVNVAAQDNDPDSLLNHYRNLIQIRKAHPALQTGQVFLIETQSTSVYAILCVNENETLLVLANLTDETISEYMLSLTDISLPDSTYEPIPLFGNVQAQTVELTQGGFHSYKPVNELPPYTMLIVQFKK